MNNTYPKKYTDALRELVETNTTFTSLVKKYSLYDIKFKKLLNEQGVRYNLKSSLQNNYKLIKEEYITQKTSLSKLSKKYKVSMNALSKRLKEDGIDIVNNQNNPFKEKYDKAKFEYINSEMSLTEIAKKYNVSRQALSRNFKKDNIEIRTQYVEYNEFDTITEESAYWLGFISADGCLRGNTLSIGLQESDYNHLVKFKEFIKTENKIRLKKHFINNKIVLSYEISVSDKHLAETLNKLGINELKTFENKFPKFLNKEMKRHFCRGLFDGDGCLRKNPKKPLNSGIIGTLDVVENFCKEANLSFRPRNLKKDVGQKSYNIIFINTWRKKESITLMKYLYSNCNIYLERKYSLGKPFL